MNQRRRTTAAIAALAVLLAVGIIPGTQVSAEPNPPAVSVGDQSGLERDTTTGSIFMPVTLSAPASEPVVVSFHTVDGTAVAGVDYQRWGTPSQPRTVTIPAGQVSVTVNVPLLSGNPDPVDKQFSLVLSGVSGGGAVLGRTTGTATIIDSDAAFGPNPTISVSSTSIVEGDVGQRRAQFLIHLSRPTASPLVVTYEVTDGTAVSGTDYVAKLPGTVVFAPGQLSRTIDVLVIPNTDVDGDREFQLIAAIAGGPPVEEIVMVGTATILDDDDNGVVDTTPPVLTLPGDQQVPATSSLGAVVTWSASANDDTDGNVPVSCAPASGSLFPIGDTLVTCEASDAAGNVASGTFNVDVSAFTVPNAVDVTAGARHTCALLDDGTVRCWGDNSSGQLGDGSTVDASEPVVVTGLVGVTSLSAGNDHTCAVIDDGTVRCWGSNGNGRLGTGSAGGIATVPAAVTNLTGAVWVAAGGAHTCAALADGTAACWGNNSSGQLGSGTVGGTTTSPTAVQSLSGVVEITAGNIHSCALLDDGTMRCWGSNGDGKLGDGTTGGSSALPVAVDSASAADGLAAGLNHTCAVTDAGTALCWGRGGFGRLGDGTTTTSSTPVAVSGLSSVAATTAGNIHSCALLADGTARCWGGNANGQLGDGTNGDSSTPVSVLDITTATAVAAGFTHSCAVLDDGTVRCWGGNANGQLGDGTNDDATVPVVVSGVGPTVDPPAAPTPTIAAADQHSCALRSDGVVRCWGLNTFGQLGDGTTDSSLIPVTVASLPADIIALTASGLHTCTLTSGGAVYCWGLNDNGQLGDGTVIDRSIPTPVVGLSAGVIAVQAGQFHTCAAMDVGGMKCWGWGTQGQLGRGSLASSTTPVDVLDLPPGMRVTSIGGGRQHTCATLDDGSARCWGRNNRGQLGNGTTTRSLVPVQPIGLTSGVSAISSGTEHSCAVQAGTAWCFGRNSAGQLGNGLADNGSGSLSVSSPVQVVDENLNPLSGLVEVTAGGEHTCARYGGGGLACWGQNQNGQMGVDIDSLNNTGRARPVFGLSSGQVSVGAGTSHSCSLDAGGVGRCWGSNLSGQIGNGTMTDAFLPSLVLGL